MENATLTKTSLNWLYQAARWAKFISILGFIFIGLLVVIGIFIGPVLSILNEDMNIASGATGVTSSVIAAIYIAIAAVYFFPIYYLFQFSRGTIRAYKTNNEDDINTSIHFLKRHFKFIGIMIIVILAIYIVVFGIGVLAMIAGLV